MIDMRESITAKLCAFARAYHSNYAQPKIFDDYLAFDLMGRETYEEMGQLVEHDFDLSKVYEDQSFDSKVVFSLLDRYLTPIPLSRTAFAEDALLRFAEQKGSCQYVICGAGMDTFAFRNTNPSIRIFELDHPDTQRYKLEQIKALEWNQPENLSYVPIDFSKTKMSTVLEQAGFDRNLPTFFSLLGVTYYLKLSVFEQTLREMSSLSGVPSQLVFDFPDKNGFSESAQDTLRYHRMTQTERTAAGLARLREGRQRSRRLAQITSKLGEEMQQGFSSSEIEQALSRNDFKILCHKTPEQIQKTFFEGRTDGQTAFETVHFILAETKRRQ